MRTQGRRPDSPTPGRRPDSPGRRPPLSTPGRDAATATPATPTAEEPARSAVTVAVRIRPTGGAKTVMRHGRRDEAALQVTAILAMAKTYYGHTRYEEASLQVTAMLAIALHANGITHFKRPGALQVTGSRGGAEEPKVFSFDHIFDQADAQSDVYAALGPPVLQVGSP
jgi:hypothetical protein